MRALLFDIGNVLVTFDLQRGMSRLSERSPLSHPAIADVITGLKQPFESGHMSEAEFVFRSMDGLDFDGTKEDFLDIWCDIFALNEPMALTLATLPQKLPAYLFSNTNGPHLRFLLERFAIFKHFDGGVYSHEAKCMKPADGMYQQAIARFGLDPAQTFYADDLPDNIATGRRLGFHAYQYDPAHHAPFHLALNAWMA